MDDLIISFYGAAGFVTGSCTMLSYKNQNILVDCGLFQGSRDLKEYNYGEFLFDPIDIDALILTHAHIDHSGLIPKLCKRGFKGPIFTTKVTKELCSVMLPDSGYIQEMEVERKNRKLRRANQPLLDPIYTISDAEQCIDQFQGVEYGHRIEILPDIFAVFHDAGHILGSAIIELFIAGKKVVLSGDLGNLDRPIVNDPSIIEAADYLVLESTYGNRFHLATEDKLVALTRIIRRTIRKGGNLIIPAFAVERTQEVIYKLKKLINAGEIPGLDIYIDSPLAIKATEIFARYTHLFDEEAREMVAEGGLLDFPQLKFTLSAQESIKLNRVEKNAIIISASGMADAGRIKHHLKHNLWRPESTILFVGYQAIGTLGRRILDGEKSVRIHGEDIAVRADIENIEGFSGHADQKGLVDWVNSLTKKPEKIFLVHGEDDARTVLAEVLQENFTSQVILPQFTETYQLTAKIPDLDQTLIRTSHEDDLLVIMTRFEKELKKVTNQNNQEIVIQELEKLKQKLI